MPDIKRYYKSTIILLLSLVILHLSVFPAIAAEADPGWRPYYDLIMMWVNFGILAFLLVKFLRVPITEFLKGRREEVAQEIIEVETKQKEMQEILARTERDLEESAIRFSEIKTRIMDEGERVKQQIIENAREQGLKLVELEKKKAVSRIGQARATFLSELVDAAAAHSQDRLPTLLTSDDHQNYLDLYLTNVNRIAG